MNAILNWKNTPLVKVTDYMGKISTLAEIVVVSNGSRPVTDVVNSFIALGGKPTKESETYIRDICGDEFWNTAISKLEKVEFNFEVNPDVLKETILPEDVYTVYLYGHR